MKVIPQIVTFLVLVALGGVVYQYHQPFQDLVNDVVQVAKLTEPVQTEPEPEQVVKVDRPKPVAKPSTVSLPEVATYAVQEPIKSKPELVTAVTQSPDKQQQKATGVISADMAGKQRERPKQPVSPSSQSAPVVQPMHPPAPQHESMNMAQPQQPAQQWQPQQQSPWGSQSNTQSVAPQPVQQRPPQQQSPWGSQSNTQSVAPQPVQQRPPQQQPAWGGQPNMQPATPQPMPPMPVTQQPAPQRPPQQQPMQPPAQQRPMPIERKAAQPAAGLSEDKVLEQQALAGLSEARTAWQEGDYEGAVGRYQDLMRQFPNHPDFAGELGNIYYAKGQRALAVDAYSEAVSRLIRMEDFSRAWELLTVIRYMDHERATELEKYFVR